MPTGKRIELEISPEFPVDPQEPTVAAFANTHRTGVSWVAVLEKALAGLDDTSSRGHPRRIENGYDRLDGGGTASDTAQVLAQLTGERAGVVRITASPGWATDLDQLVEDLLGANKPVVVGMVRNNDRYSVLPYGLRGPHAYDVTEITDEGMTLRNPTGTFHPQRVSSSQLIQYLDGQLSVVR
ncbi:calpain family cysteine peptidase [Tenggerimyces flavus]|uniref:Calpain catalytic domain-containing protein n=1 Tax=Tenggerimyces flavus TaxID=1708749 RepID=A0ABV7YIS7_9ACTN|nr:hypothetical protein [Tenggerimyces flavus]MBM7787293.1 hypothetical protein [Tenggerimyces flavus]